MSSLTILALCSLAIGGNDSDSYVDAHQATMKTGRPMLVMVSTDWCAPCQVMKKSIMPEVKQRGILARVAFAIVNPDRDRELAQQLTGGGPVPQLVLFRKTSDGWMRRKLIGGQSVEAVEQFIKEEVAADQTEKKDKEKKTVPDSDKKHTTADSPKRPTA